MKTKHIIFGLALLMLFLVSCDGTKNPVQPQEPQASLNYVPYWSAPTAFTTDTLTNADTMTYNLGSYNRPVALEVVIAADSLSGSTAATATLEHSIDGTHWFVVDTETINGVTSRLKATGDILGGTVRCRVISTGTQSTTLDMDAIIAESTPQQ